MYGSYLSYRQVTQFLELIIESGLLDYDIKNGLYRINERGLQYLELYDKMDELIKERSSSITGSLILLLCYVFYPLLSVLGEFI